MIIVKPTDLSYLDILVDLLSTAQAEPDLPHQTTSVVLDRLSQKNNDVTSIATRIEQQVVRTITSRGPLELIEGIMDISSASLRPRREPSSLENTSYWCTTKQISDVT